MSATHPVTVAVPAAVFDALVREAKRDHRTLAEWLVDAATMQLNQRRPSRERHRATGRCVSCDSNRRIIWARGRCRRCYYREYEAARCTNCEQCKRWKRFVMADGHRLCQACYMRLWRKRRAAA